MRKILLPLLSIALLSSCAEDQKTPEATDPMVKNTATTTADNKSMPAEFADPKYTQWGKERMKLFAAGDIDKWGEGLADNVMTYWSGGDSIVGKKAIIDYWKDRWAKHIESLEMSNDIWMGIKVNVPQQKQDMPGIWSMSWNQTNVKYKNGKSLQFWIHQGYHYNAADKIDRIITYMDRAPINAALGTK